MNFRPMLAVNGDPSLINVEDCIFEPKLDGYRAFLVKNKEIRWISRNNKDFTKEYPELDPKINANSCIIDGEIVAFNERGNPNFNYLQNHSTEVTFVAFDILQKNSQDLTNLKLLERKRILRDTLIETHRVRLLDFTKEGKKLWALVKKRKLEGMIAKKTNSIYEQGRSEKWIKIKLLNTIDCIIIGYRSGKRNISSLAIGLRQKKDIIYIGQVGTGFSDSQLTELQSKLVEESSKRLSSMPADIIQVRAKLVCEVVFLELTPDNILRAPVFKRLREDKTPEDCTTDQLRIFKKN